VVDGLPYHVHPFFFLPVFLTLFPVQQAYWFFVQLSWKMVLVPNVQGVFVPWQLSSWFDWVWI
jgi:hypothetical protein